MNTCGRCGFIHQEPFVRMTLVARFREARRDGHKHTGPDYEHGYRCRDVEACDRRRIVAQEAS